MLFDFTFVNSNLDIICIVLSISATLSSVKLTKAKKNSTPLAEPNTKSKHDKKKTAFCQNKSPYYSDKTPFRKNKTAIYFSETPSFLLNFSIPLFCKSKSGRQIDACRFFLCLIAEHIFHFLEEALLFTRGFGLKLFVFVQFVQ